MHSAKTTGHVTGNGRQSKHLIDGLCLLAEPLLKLFYSWCSVKAETKAVINQFC